MPRSRNADALLTEYQYEGRLTDDLIEALGGEDLFQPVNEGLDDDEIEPLPEETFDTDDFEC